MQDMVMRAHASHGTPHSECATKITAFEWEKLICFACALHLPYRERVAILRAHCVPELTTVAAPFVRRKLAEIILCSI